MVKKALIFLVLFVADSETRKQEHGATKKNMEGLSGLSNGNDVDGRDKNDRYMACKSVGLHPAADGQSLIGISVMVW